MNTLKNLLTITVLVLFAGCATVTDANLDSEQPDEPTVTTSTVDGDDWLSGAGEDMDPIIDPRDDNER